MLERIFSPSGPYRRRTRSTFRALSTSSTCFSPRKPSRTRTSTTASLRRECGTSSRSLRAPAALRIRVSRSATGSVIDISLSSLLPGRLHEAGDLALVREPPQAEPAEPELAVVRAGAAADPAAVAVLRALAGLL